MLIAFLLNIVYIIALVIASPILIYKIIVKGKYLKTFSQRLGFLSAKQADVWIHGVSVGEVKAALPLVKKLREHTSSIVISATSSRGVEMAKSLYPEHEVVSFPLDFSWSVISFFRKIRPKLIVLMELELWPNFLLLADRHKISVVLVNGRLSENSGNGYYRYLRWGFARATQAVKVFAMQNDLYSQRLARLRIESDRIATTGNIKFDAASNILSLDEATKSLFNIDDKIVLVAGSTHWPEEKWIWEAYQKVYAKFNKLRLILVPRHPERAAELLKFIKSQQGRAVRKSQLNEPVEDGVVIIGDVMGELAQTYTICDLVCIGGSFIPHGGQNFIEPASLGKIVVCGPFMNNFPDIQHFIEEKAALQVDSDKNLHNTFEDIVTDIERYRELGVRAKSLVDKNKGSVEKNLQICLKFLRR